MHVKICGITNLPDALLAAQAGADFIGLIRAPSERAVAADVALEIINELRDTPTRPVLLFRDAPLEELAAACRDCHVAWVQLHGHESVNYLARLAAALPHVRIIKAWELTPSDSGDALIAYVREAGSTGLRIAAVILDAPKGGAHPGYDHLAAISRRCNEAWSNAESERPELWCAGGLTTVTLAAAVANGTYDGVDVARGVEQSAGRKDRGAVRQFIEIGKSL